MRFNEIIQNQLEITDDVIEEYINATVDEEDFSVDNFLQFLNDSYYISDFIEIEDCEYTLEEDNLLNEINRIKAQMNNQ